MSALVPWNCWQEQRIKRAMNAMKHRVAQIAAGEAKTRALLAGMQGLLRGKT